MKQLDIEHWRAEKEHYAQQLRFNHHEIARRYHQAAQAVIYYDTHGELPRWARTEG